MKILIIGSEGFLGSSLYRYFQRNGAHVLYTLDIQKPVTTGSVNHFQTDCAEIGAVLSRIDIDLIINASGSANVQASFDDTNTDYRLNYKNVERLMDAVESVGSDIKVIHFSSAAIYGVPTKLPIAEDDSALSLPISPYGVHKKKAEELLAFKAKTSEIKSHSLRVFSTYGPRQKKLLFYDIFKKATASSSNRVELFGTGQESRDYIYIDDLCRAISCIIDNAPFDGSAINVAGGVETTIEYASALAAKQISPSLSIEFNGMSRTGDPKNWLANIDKLRSYGYSPSVSFEQGIAEYYNWLKGIEQ